MRSFRTVIFLFFLAMNCLVATAQEYKAAIKAGGKLKIGSFAGWLKIQSHSGNEVILRCDGSQPEQANGLQLISSIGQDNTGVGMNAQVTDYGLMISGISRKENREYTILVPEKVNVSIHSQGWQCKKIQVENLKSEVEIQSEYPSLHLVNVTGPVVLKSTYGKVKVEFSQVNQEKPISLISTYAELEVSLPESTKAKIKMQSEYGDIYTDLKINMDKSENGSETSMTKLNRSTISGTINGGGVEIFLKSPYSDIYLRKK